MAKIHTLKDNFDDNSLSAQWSSDNGTETGQQLRIAANTSSGTYNTVVSTTTYDLTASRACVQLVNAGSLTVNTMEVYPVELYDASESYYLYWALEYGTDEIAAYKIDGSTSELFRASYNSSTHAWFRIREASGTIYFDTSTDGLTWTNRASTTVGFSITALKGAMDLLNPSSGSNTIIFDNWNYITGTASIAPLVVTTAIPSVTATHVSVHTASVASLSCTLALPTIAATHSYLATASLAPITSTLAIPSISATYIAIYSASVSALVSQLAIPSLTATSAIEISASVIALVATSSLPSVTATYESVLTSIASPITPLLTLPAVTATYASGTTASVYVLAATLTIPSITGNYESVLSADTSSLSVLLTIPSVTAESGVQAFDAVVSPLSLLITFPEVNIPGVWIHAQKDTAVWDLADRVITYTILTYQDDSIHENQDDSLLYLSYTNLLTWSNTEKENASWTNNSRSVYYYLAALNDGSILQLQDDSILYRYQTNSGVWTSDNVTTPTWTNKSKS